MDLEAEESLWRTANETRALRAPQAKAAMEAAAEHALARGDLLAAAHAYLNIVWIVQHQKHRTRSEVELLRVSIEKARRLASSPQLTEAERASLLTRIEPLRERGAVGEPPAMLPSRPAPPPEPIPSGRDRRPLPSGASTAGQPSPER